MKNMSILLEKKIKVNNILAVNTMYVRAIDDEARVKILQLLYKKRLNAVQITNRLKKLGYKKALCLNTAANDLSTVYIPDNQKFILDVGQGGAGKNMDRGESAALKYQQEIYDLMRKIFGQKTEHIFICFGEIFDMVD